MQKIANIAKMKKGEEVRAALGHAAAASLNAEAAARRSASDVAERNKITNDIAAELFRSPPHDAASTDPTPDSDSSSSGSGPGAWRRGSSG